MSRFKNIKDLVCLVTGGASGLGRATCERLASKGAKVVIADILNREGEELSKQLGSSTVFSACDVTNSQHIERAVQLARERFGRLDVAISNAGIAITNRTYSAKKDSPHPLDKFERIMKVNVVGAFDVARLAAQLMAKNEPDADGQRGVIVMTASIAAYVAEPGLTAYAASKGAVASMTLPIARDLANLGIRAISIAPGPFDTAMLGSAGAKALAALNIMPFPKRAGQPDEFAQLVETAITDTMLNGCVLRIDAAYN